MMNARYPEALSPFWIAEYSEQLAALAEPAAMTAPVPTCGDWTMSDLLWHLMEVQDFWGHIIRNRPNGREGHTPMDRPSDNDLGAGLRGATQRLVAALEAADPSEPAWSWAEEQTVGFSVRRQTHEALVHLADGLLAVGQPLPVVNPLLGADGVDEMVTIMIDEPGLEATVHLSATDTGDSWKVGSAASGTITSESMISALASDLNFWLWGRADDSAVTVTGDPGNAETLRAFITEHTQ